MFFSNTLYLKYIKESSGIKYHNTGGSIMKKVAIPLVNKQLSPYFEKCSAFLIFSVDDKNLIKSELEHSYLQSGLFPYWLAQRGVTDIIVRRVSEDTIHKFDQFKINVFVGVKIAEPKELIKEFLSGTLETDGALVNN